MAKRDYEPNPAEPSEDRDIDALNEGRMPAPGDDVRGVAEPGEDATELEDDEGEEGEGDGERL